ncbi:hypothetical protein [Rhizobium sp. LjRoot254]|uniref:hypothetical protein n=1 Tax=Rhizobium sp. LjRoot254 TaxID=3342297 RepID=UPI003ECF65CF
MEFEEGTLHLQCDVELEFVGPTVAVVNKWAADTLRKLADRIEQNEFDSAWHDVTDNVGKPVGKLYVDYSETFEEP